MPSYSSVSLLVLGSSNGIETFVLGGMLMSFKNVQAKSLAILPACCQNVPVDAMLAISG